MQFSLNAEDTLLVDSVRGQFQELFPFSAVQQFADQLEIEDARHEVAADIGIYGVCAGESAGGLDLGALEALLVTLEAGRNLVPLPVSEMIAATAALSQSHVDLTGQLIKGRLSATVTWYDCVVATQTSDGWSLSGLLDAVPWAAQSDYLLLPARPSQDGCARDAFLVRLDDPSVELISNRGLDLTCPVARVRINSLLVRESDRLSGAATRLRNLVAICCAAEMLGAAERAFEMTVAYLKVRRQFGQVIGSFQSLKHIAANDMASIESMRVAIQYAGWALDTAADDAEMAVAIAMSFISGSARTVIENCIQLHGGIAYTWKFGLHLFYRRILRCAVTAGSVELHREAIASLLIDSVIDSGYSEG